jgi:osmotically-inducible protein OsmY
VARTRGAVTLARIALVAFLALAAAPAPLDAQVPAALPEAREQARRLVVMVDGRFEDEATRGAGIVIGTWGDRLYLATAYHVVRRDGAVARDVTVRLLTVPGQRFPATVLEHADRWLDLAVLSVVGERGQPPGIAGIPFASLGAPRELKLGDPLFAVGNPLGTAWGDNLTPYLFRKSDGDQFAFEALSIQVGHSGGGVFDRGWRLVGMVVRDEPPDAVALSIERIVGRLADWGYPIALTVPPATGTGATGTSATGTGAPADGSGSSAQTPPFTRPSQPSTGAPAGPAGDDLRARVVTALKARQIEGLAVDLEDDTTVSLAGAISDPQIVRTAISTARSVRGVRSVTYRFAVRGRQDGRPPAGPSIAPDVLRARVQHNLAQSRIPAVQIAVSPALGVHLSGTVASDIDLVRVISVARSAGARAITYEIDVVGRQGR